MHASAGSTGTLGAVWRNATWRKRRRYVVDWRVQLRLVRQFLGFVLLAMVLGAFLVHLLFYVREAYLSGPLAYPGGSLAERIVPWLLVLAAVAVTVGIFVLLGLFYSHRLAGPARKLAGALMQMAEGRLEQPVRLRDTDYLHEVARAANHAERAWTQAASRVHQALVPLRGPTEELTAETLHRQVAEIEAAIARFVR
jgi:hypothetical protein